MGTSYPRFWTASFFAFSVGTVLIKTCATNTKRFISGTSGGADGGCRVVSILVYSESRDWRNFR